jgi:hypothetical protein
MTRGQTWCPGQPKQALFRASVEESVPVSGPTKAPKFFPSGFERCKISLCSGGVATGNFLKESNISTDYIYRILIVYTDNTGKLGRTPSASVLSPIGTGPNR